MLKVVLIDDEPFVIEGLLEMIQWQEYGFKVTGVANDGLSGLQLVVETEPDLVITDIRMPELDGLKMIEQCQKTIKKDISFLVLSGYSDFDYIKTAMDLRSMSYILKPIDPDEIHHELEKLKNTLDEQQRRNLRLNENIRVVTRMTINRILEEPMKKSLIERAAFLLEFNPQKACFIGVLKQNNQGDEELDKVSNMFFQATQQEQVEYLVLSQQERYLHFIAWGQSEDVIRLREMFILMTHKEFNDNYHLVISAVMNDLSRLKEALAKVDLRLAASFYENVVIDVVDFDYETCFSKEIAFFETQQLIDQTVQLRAGDIDYYLNGLFRKIRQLQVDPMLLQLRWESLLEGLSSYYGQRYTGEFPDNYRDFKQLFTQVIKFYNGINKKNDQPEMTQHIREYIEKHYMDDLKLKAIAKQFGYNPVYLGQLFMKETGEKYNDYILKVRISKAKAMLLYTDKSVKEIALNIGFNNPDYFVQKFKEIEGQSPSHYRV